MTAVQCSECGRTLGGNAALCRPCVDELAEQLLRVPALLHELGVTRAGLGRSGPPARGSGPAEPPLPVRIVGRRGLLGESAVQRLETAVIGWARVVAEELGVTPAVNISYLVDLTQARRTAWQPDHPADPSAVAEPVSALEQAAIWLAHYKDEIARHEAAPELSREIHEAIRALHIVIDLPRELQPIGPCPRLGDNGEQCGRELLADKDSAWVRCPTCGQQNEVAAVRASTLRAADNMVFTIDEVVTLLDRVNESVPRGTIHSWVSRQKLHPRAWRRENGQVVTYRSDRSDRAMYRLGDIRELRVAALRHPVPEKEAG